MGQFDQDEQKGNLKQFVTFSVDNEEYGLEILEVQEIVRLPHITKLPRAPIFIKGVINLRGNVIPILDLREKFDLETKEYNDTTRVIIVEVAAKKIGMIVDTVAQVIRVPESNIAPPPSMASDGENDYINGVVQLDDRLIILLKISSLLSTEEVVQLQQVEADHVKETTDPVKETEDHAKETVEV